MQQATRLAREVVVPYRQQTRLEVGFDALERVGVRVESRLREQVWLSLCGLSAVFMLCTSLVARRMPLVFDEILTRYVSALPTFGAMWKSLMAHAEASPPLFHLISKLSGVGFGFSRLALRMPAIVGYLAMMWCVSIIVQRYASPLYAAIGIFSTYVVFGQVAAVSARPYGLLLGFSSVALVCWQRAAREGQRKLALAGLGLSLAAALGVHFYAVLTFLAIGCGELVRTRRTRRGDGVMWLILGLGALPLIFFAPLIRAHLVFVRGFFSPPTMANFAEALMDAYLPMRGILAVGFLLLVCVCVLAIGRKENPASLGSRTPPVYEMAAWVMLLLAPVEVFLAGRLGTGAFTARYGIVALIGFSILLPLVLQRLFRNSRAAALVMLLFLAACFAGWYRLGLRKDDPTAQLVPWLAASNPSHLPVVVADATLYLPLAYGAPKELANDLAYLLDAEAALKYTGMDSAERSLGALRNIAPLNLPSYSSFADSHQNFLLLWRDSRFDWIVPKLRDAGAELRVNGTLDGQILFLVNFRHPEAKSGNLPGS